MLKKHKNTQKLPFIIILFIFAIVFITLLSYTASPLFTKHIYGDSFFYKIAGKGVLDGIIPFRDISSQKGPFFLLFEGFIEFLNQLFNSYYLGTYIVEIINIFLCMLIWYSWGTKLTKNRNFSLIAVLITMFVFITYTFDVGNMTEEFSLLPISISINYALDYFVDNKDKVKTSTGFIVGLMGAIAFWIRPNNATQILCVLLFFFIILVQKKQLSVIIKNGLAFSASFILFSAIILAFYHYNGALDDLIYQCFTYNATSYVSGSSFFNIINFFKLSALYGFIFGSIVMIWIKKDDAKFRYLCIFSLCLNIPLLASYYVVSSNYNHYLMFFAINSIIFSSQIYLFVKDSANVKPCISIIVLIVLLFGSSNCIRKSILSAKTSIEMIIHPEKTFFEGYNEYNSEVSDDIFEITDYMNKRIPESQKKSVSVPTQYPCIYYFSNTYPFYHEGSYEWVQTFSKEKQEEFYSALFNNSPQWVVLKNGTLDYAEDNMFLEFILENYSVDYSNNSFCLYHLSNSAF